MATKAKVTDITTKNVPGPILPRVKLWLSANGESVFCRGLCDILQAVEATGSIKEAAARVDRSYRFVWARIKEAEQAIGGTLVETHVGGRGTQRSQLSPLARELIQEFEAVCTELRQLVDVKFAKRLSRIWSRHSEHHSTES